MNRPILALTAAIAALLASAAPVTESRQKSAAIDLSTPAGAALAQRKIQCSAIDNVAVTYTFHGEAFARVPGERDRKLFDVEGMNVRQCVTVTDPQRGTGWRLVSRELLLYIDPATGQILREWKNPWTGQTVKVLQTTNDPVNQRPVFPATADSRLTGWRGTINGDTWWDTITVPLFYSNPLAGAYQKQIGGFYHATEMFNFFGKVSELTDPRNPSPAVNVGWVRMADWLPWMEMSGRAGIIYMHAAGRKIDDYSQLPKVMRDAIEQEYPAYRTPPPGDDTRENETSWTLYKKAFPAPAAGQPAGK